MTCECDEKYTRNYYRYYDTPDGCDVMNKAMVTTRYGVLAGLIISTYDSLMYSHATGFGPLMSRYMYHTLPLAAMGATFAFAANGAQHAREKDDVINYFLGGMACGPIAAMYLGSKHAILLGGLALGTIGMIKKYAVDSNATIIPDPQPHMGLVNGWRHDFSVVPDPKDVLQHTCGKPK